MNKISTTLILFLLANLAIAQDGKILSKRLVDISQTPIWERISQDNELLPAFNHLNKLDLYFIAYQSDSLIIRGLMMEPKEEGKYPVIIFNRGGNRDFGQLSIGTLIMYTSKLAAEGYVVLGSNYREKDEFGGEEINDVLNLMETAKEIDKADPNSIGMFGWSRGGMMTYLALRKSDKIKTAIVGNGPTDLFGLIADRPKMETNVLAECVPNYWDNKASELKKRSVVHWPDELNKNSSLLILCGIKDKRLKADQSSQLAEKLEEINYDFELKKYDTDHYFTGHKEELNQLVIDWFDSRLKGPGTN
ncbi:alpha/beta hydrolase family protein [Aureibacter tunicatorum]|uniref:Dipeptidyl aminopeptidase/acylaminoacyl peptidase n=1 Tax=Aureibacter tunicatorum TaxID=866807 RepID=A0AAE3XRB3_9BACT|nr:prolyl oligopeptidase family serine peptidase [Aureibacter tunicatorum]MDR6241177.1 dipeptidyl aminopeptidase/acylaminoacyl peptidase [Aureibacter tunicatorum]BDD03952.1 peptidase [Aureibacter tunicatorum]